MCALISKPTFPGVQKSSFFFFLPFTSRGCFRARKQVSKTADCVIIIFQVYKKEISHQTNLISFLTYLTTWSTLTNALARQKAEKEKTAEQVMLMALSRFFDISE